METDSVGAWLTERQPTTRQNWCAVTVAAVALIAFGAIAPFASMPLTALNIFFPLLDAIVFVTDGITSVLLFGQFSISRSRALLALAAGYLFTALIVIPHALTFSGAFSPTGLLGAGIQTGSWLFIFWHLGFSMALLAYALLTAGQYQRRTSDGSALPAIIWSTAAVVALVCALTWLATEGASLLPAVIIDQSRLSHFVIYPVSFAMLISAAAFCILLFRQYSVLDLWLMVVALVFNLELVFSGLLPSVRFSAGFYGGRAFSLVTASIVLIFLLAETTRLYARLARSNAIMQSERKNRLMNFDAIVNLISHELKQPLATIELDGSSASAILERATPNIVDVRTAVQDMQGAGRRILETLDGIRSLFGETNLQRQLVDLNEVVIEALQSSRVELKNDDVTAGMKLAETLPPCLGVRSQLNLVISNLIHNAIEAMRSARGGYKMLKVRTKHHGDSAIAVEVEDSGPGIHPDIIAKVFEPFMTTKANGMGLGLAISRMIVERHEGQLSISSGKTRGVVIRMVLPRAKGYLPNDI